MPNSNFLADPNNVNKVQTAPQQNSINTDENPELPLVVNKIENTFKIHSHEVPLLVQSGLQNT